MILMLRHGEGHTAPWDAVGTHTHTHLSFPPLCLFVGSICLPRAHALNQGDPLSLEPSLSGLGEGRQKRRSQQKPQGLSEEQGLTSYQME